MSANAGKSPCAAGSGSSRTRIAVPPPLVAVTRFSLTYYARSASGNAIFSRETGTHTRRLITGSPAWGVKIRMRPQFVAQGCRALSERSAAFAEHHRTGLIGSPQGARRPGIVVYLTAMRSVPQTQPPSPELVFDTLNAYQRTAALKGAIQLDVFTAIGEGNAAPKAIAARCQTSERGMRILCDYLVIIGFLTKQGSKWLRWILVELSSHAIHGAPQFRRLYERVARKHGANTGRVAVARAMLKTIYAMLKHQEAFRPLHKGRAGQRQGVMAD